MVCPKDILLNIGSDEYAHLQSEDQGPSILIVCWLFTGLALLFVLARLFVRGWIVKRFYADDYWCTLGWVRNQQQVLHRSDTSSLTVA